MKRLAWLAVIALLAPSTVLAMDAASPRLKVYGMFAYVSPLSESDQDFSGVTEAVKASSELGYSLGFEYRASSLLGLEFDYTYAKHDLTADQAGLLGTASFQPISGTLNFHLLPGGTLDVYGGPTASYVNWGDLEIPSSLGGGTSSIDAEFTFGLSAGVDLDVTPSIALTGGLRWLSVKAEGDQGDAVDVNPLITRFGVGMRF